MTKGEEGAYRFADLVLTVPCALFTAYVWSRYWTWFAVEHLGLREIGFNGALAAMLLVGVVGFGKALTLSRIRKAQLKDDQSATEGLIGTIMWIFVYNPIALGCGWLWHWGMS